MSFCFRTWPCLVMLSELLPIWIETSARTRVMRTAFTCFIPRGGTRKWEMLFWTNVDTIAVNRLWTLSCFVRHVSSSIDADVVFVHGLRGGPFMTWRQQEEKDVKQSGTDCWPKVLHTEWIPLFFSSIRLNIALEFLPYILVKPEEWLIEQGAVKTKRDQHSIYISIQLYCQAHTC